MQPTNSSSVQYVVPSDASQQHLAPCCSIAACGAKLSHISALGSSQHNRGSHSGLVTHSTHAAASRAHLLAWYSIMLPALLTRLLPRTSSKQAVAIATNLHKSSPMTTTTGHGIVHGEPSAHEAPASAGQPLAAATIASITQETPTVRHLVLSLENPNAFSFKPGQWVDLHIPGVSQVGGFSICSPPQLLDQAGQIELGVKYSGWPPAKWIHQQARVGDKVHVRVGGTFLLDASHLHGNLLMVGGGIGITPLMSMLHHWLLQRTSLAESGTSTSKAVLLYSAKTPHEFALMHRLEALAVQHPASLHVRLHSTQQPWSHGHSDNHITNSRRRDTSSDQPANEPTTTSSTGADCSTASMHILNTPGTSSTSGTAGSSSPPRGASGPAILHQSTSPPANVSKVSTRITKEDLLEAVQLVGEASPAFVCGPPKMTDHMMQQLQQLGMQHVHAEKWW